MRLRFLWVAVLFAGSLAAQNTGTPTDPDHVEPPIPPDLITVINTNGNSSLGMLNFYALLPSAERDFRIINPHSKALSVMVVYEASGGGRQTRTLTAGPHETLFFLGIENRASAVHILALENFLVRWDNPAAGEQSEVAVYQPPSLPLLHTLISPSGEVVSVFVDDHGNVHYPIRGRIIGEWREETRTAILLGGTVLHGKR